MYKAVPTTMQMQAADCGAASLKMILDYFECYHTLEEIRTIVGVGNDGSTIGDIRKAAEKLGLALDAEEMQLPDLHKIAPPCILWWDHVHFVVYEGRLGGIEVINDPAMGRRRLNYAEFMSSWAGVAVFPTDHSKIVKSKSSSIVATSAIIDFMFGKSYAPVALGLFFNTIGIIPAIILSQLTAYFTDQVLILNQLSTAKSLLWTFFALTGASALLSAASYYLTSRANLITGVDRSLAMYKFILKLPMTWHDSRNPQELANRLSLPISIVNTLTYSMVSSIGTLLQSAIILAFVFAINVPLALMFLSVFVVVFAITLYISHISKDANQALSVENGKQQSTALGTLSDLENIRSIGEENHQFSTWSGYYTNYINFQQRISVNQSYATLASFSASYLFTTILIISAPILIINGSISIGDFIGLQFLVGYLNSGVSIMPTLLTQYQTISSPATRIRDAFESATESNSIQNVDTLMPNAPHRNGQTYPKNAHITATSVGFSYREGKQVINELDLNIDCKKILCLKAKPGSGITTVLKLISGLITPTSGTIEVSDETGKRNIALGDVRYVPSEPTILDMDFAANISLLDNQYNLSDITNAAKSSGIFKSVKGYPKGLYTDVPGHGAGLSNSLRNQLIIARIILSKDQYTVVDTFIDELDENDAQSFVQNLNARNTGCLVVCNNDNYQKLFDGVIEFN